VELRRHWLGAAARGTGRRLARAFAALFRFARDRPEATGLFTITGFILLAFVLQLIPWSAPVVLEVTVSRIEFEVEGPSYRQLGSLTSDETAKASQRALLLQQSAWREVRLEVFDVARVAAQALQRGCASADERCEVRVHSKSPPSVDQHLSIAAMSSDPVEISDSIHVSANARVEADLNVWPLTGKVLEPSTALTLRVSNAACPKDSRAECDEEPFRFYVRTAGDVDLGVGGVEVEPHLFGPTGVRRLGMQMSDSIEIEAEKALGLLLTAPVRLRDRYSLAPTGLRARGIRFSRRGPTGGEETSIVDTGELTYPRHWAIKPVKLQAGDFVTLDENSIFTIESMELLLATAERQDCRRADARPMIQGIRVRLLGEPARLIVHRENQEQSGRLSLLSALWYSNAWRSLTGLWGS
jgi:hypothetical protein